VVVVFWVFGEGHNRHNKGTVRLWQSLCSIVVEQADVGACRPQQVDTATCLCGT
jgi:hypothetical protein